MKLNWRKKSYFAVIAVGLMVSQSCYAISIKGKKPSGADKSVLIPISSGSNSTSNLELSSSSKFKFKTSSKKARVAFLVDNTTVPTVLAIKKGKKVYSVSSARKKGICDDDGAVALTVAKKTFPDSKYAFLTLNGETATAYLKGGTKKAPLKTLLKKVDKSVTASLLDSSCNLEGNAANQGLSSNSGSSSLGILADDNSGDSDSDGLPDLIDSDADNDGVFNNYDSDFDSATENFHVFTNFKVQIENTINTNTGVTPTKSELDSLMASTTTVAMEVKADETNDEESELDCGDLSYCSTGGTGSVGFGSEQSDFPGVAGGTLDPDSDGDGTMEKGGTGDFQLRTGAASDEIAGGDTFTQIVTDADGKETEYLASLQFVFASTPALKSLTLNPGDSSEATTTFSYPLNSSSPGTTNNCISVTENTDGDVVLRIVAWRPQRPGVEAAGEGDYVDIGNSRIGIDIPNPPCTLGGGGGCSGSFSGRCVAANYSTSDSNLSIGSELLTDLKADSDADPANTFTFDINVTDCLATGSETLDSGESLFLDLQLSNDVGDNSAVKFCVQR